MKKRTNMSEPEIKRIRVAAIQMVCEEAKIAHNLEHAAKLLEQAVEKGAELLLLPELMPGGYMLTEAIWDAAETMEGRSVDWLKEKAKEHGIHVGFSFLEADGEDFYNTFVLATPKGEIAGRVRKNPAASIEAHFYKAGSDRHVIETELGRIGVGICYENLLYDRICELMESSVDLVLSPSAAGMPKPLIPGDVRRFEEMLIRWRYLYGDVLGVPNVMANRVGPLETELPGMLPYLKSTFPGLSAITNADGEVLAELGGDEGVIVADIELNPAKKRALPPKCYGSMWALPVPWYAFIWPLTQKSGEKGYEGNPRRSSKARAMSSQ